jgi:hypothetical protein
LPKRIKTRIMLLLPIFLALFFSYSPQNATAAAAPCDTYQVNGGDQAFLMNLNTPLEWGGTVYTNNIYVSPKGTITFGVGDYTFWDYPPSPSISIGSWDYHAFPNQETPGVWSPGWGYGNNLYVRYGSTATSICVDWKVMVWGQTTGDPIYIRMLAEVNPVNYTWTPTYQVSSNAPAGARYGARYIQNGPIQPLSVQTITEPPIASPTPSPTETSTPTPTPTETPLESPTPTPTTTETLEPTPEPTPIQTQDPNPIDPGPDPIPVETRIDEPEIEMPEAAQEEQEIVLEPSQTPTPIVEQPIISEQILIPEGQVLLENGVILDEEIAIALVLLENPAELFSTLFSDPGQVLTALSNIGADMSPEVREEAQDIVVVAVIVTQILSSVTMSSSIVQMNARAEIRRMK